MNAPDDFQGRNSCKSRPGVCEFSRQEAWPRPAGPDFRDQGGMVQVWVILGQQASCRHWMGRPPREAEDTQEPGDRPPAAR